MIVDHINGNTLDNRKLNLRICKNEENVRNQKLSKRNKTGYKGVSYNKRLEKFCATIRFKNKTICLGHFENKIDAAIAYNNSAIKYFGEFSKLNEI
jgi:hypothetical protein